MKKKSKKVAKKQKSTTAKRSGRPASHTDAEIVKAAKRFYEGDEKQKDIGKKMKPKIVGSYVSRVLKDAKAAGKFKVKVVVGS